ncbi:hypothetical protein Clacol_007076 [Clathrus columnatus]|uniref:Cytochrome P450 n=1 Tax=Clathrus columnatus TaxID=1419009 RepID=A0AAV5AK48_9AGAM|nr:hypothetical protein Clacol_007076 [Clathrus columnatus]
MLDWTSWLAGLTSTAVIIRFFGQSNDWKWVTIGALWLSTSFIFYCLQAMYRWNFVMLKDLSGPPSPSFFLGHMEGIHLDEYPKAISHVMNNDDLFPRSEATRQVLQTAFPNGVFVSEGMYQQNLDITVVSKCLMNTGEEHRRQRRPVSGAFIPPSVQELSDTLFDLINGMVESLKDEIINFGNEGEFMIDVLKRIQILTTDAISRTAFAYSIQDSTGPIPELLDRLGKLDESLFTVILQLIMNKIPWLVNIPNPVTKKWARLRFELGKVADDVWEKGVVNKGLHSKLLDAIGRGERDIAISQIMGVLFAGSETTANIITEAIHKLTLYPEVQKKLRKELQDFIEAKGRPIEHEELINPNLLPYLDAVMKEALRCLASVPQLSRQAGVHTTVPLEFPITLPNGRTVSEIQVEPGQTILMPVRDGINTCPDIWGPDAKKFVPERWLDEKLPPLVEKIKVPGHVFTFGDGPKLCLGRAFAYSEFKIFVSTLVLNFEFSTPSAEDMKTIVFHLSGPTVKPRLKGREREAATLPLAVKLL